MKKNFISVIIPAHNEEDVISKAINSVLCSTYKNYEIIVVNNGSTDNTKPIVNRFVKKYPRRIRLINFPSVSDKNIAKNRGPAFSRNQGAEVAKGDILAFLDADDWMCDDTLANIIKAFEDYKEIDFLIGFRELFVPRNWKRIFLYYWLVKKKWIFDKEIEVMIDTPCCPYVMKTHNFFKVGKFDESLYYHEDNDFRLRLNKMKIPKLVIKKVHTYSDMGCEKRDFLRRCKNTAKGSLTNRVNLFKVFILFLFSFFTFPIFYLSAFFYVYFKSKDLLVSLTAPILYFIRRFLDIYYLLNYL
jgi:glycosyltransferase involved in cell wall biosynthesis